MRTLTRRLSQSPRAEEARPTAGADTQATTPVTYQYRPLHTQAPAPRLWNVPYWDQEGRLRRPAAHRARRLRAVAPARRRVPPPCDGGADPSIGELGPCRPSGSTVIRNFT